MTALNLLVSIVVGLMMIQVAVDFIIRLSDG